MTRNDHTHTIEEMVLPPAYVDTDQLETFEDGAGPDPPVVGMPRCNYPLDWSRTVLTALQKTNGRCRVCGTSNEHTDLHVQFYFDPSDQPQLNDHKNTIVWCAECAGVSKQNYDITTVEKGTVTSLEDLDELDVSDIEESNYPVDLTRDEARTLHQSGGGCETCGTGNSETELYVQQYDDPGTSAGEKSTHIHCRECMPDESDSRVSVHRTLDKGTITTHDEFEQFTTTYTLHGEVDESDDESGDECEDTGGVREVITRGVKALGGVGITVGSGVLWMGALLLAPIFFGSVIGWTDPVVTSFWDQVLLGVSVLSFALTPVCLVYGLRRLFSERNQTDDSSTHDSEKSSRDEYVYDALTVHTPHLSNNNPGWFDE